MRPYSEKRWVFRSIMPAAIAIALSLVPGRGWPAAAGNNSRGPGMRSADELARQGVMWK